MVHTNWRGILKRAEHVSMAKRNLIVQINIAVYTVLCTDLITAQFHILKLLPQWRLCRYAYSRKNYQQICIILNPRPLLKNIM